jgi:hypothetical protein
LNEILIQNQSQNSKKLTPNEKVDHISIDSYMVQFQAINEKAKQKNQKIRSLNLILIN